MSKQPEAIVLAEKMESVYASGYSITEEQMLKTSFELRRLHAANVELLEVCKQTSDYYSASLDHQPSYVKMARVALARHGATS